MLEEQAADLPVFGEGNFISYTNWLYNMSSAKSAMWLVTERAL